MAIIFDEMGHMVSTESESDLHCFAGRIGLLRKWYQNKKRPHYDLTTSKKRAAAERMGAILVNSRDLVKMAWWSIK